MVDAVPAGVAALSLCYGAYLTEIFRAGNESISKRQGEAALMFLSRTLGTKTFQHMEMLVTVAVLYWLLTIALESGQARIEAHYRKRDAR